MKKKAGLILAALLLCAVLAAGAEGDWSVTAEDYAQYGGRWVLTHMISGGQEYLVSDFGMEAFLDLKEDGTVDANQGGEITPGHWKAEDGKVWVELEGSIQSGPVEDGKMRLGVDEDMLMIFSREDGTEIPAAPGPGQAELITAESPEELSGTWQAEWMMMEGMKVRVSNEQILSSWELFFGSTDQQVIIQGTHAVMFGTEQEFTFRNGRLEQVPEETAGMDNPDYFSKFLQLRDDGTLSLRLMGMEILCSRTGDAEPMPEPTPEPTEEPTPEPTPEPTEEPTPEPTPEPTEEPTPEPTPEPTEEPTPEPTPEPTEEPEPEPDFPEEDLTGEWYAVYLRSGRVEGHPRQKFNTEITLTLNEDHTGSLLYLGTDEEASWTVNEEGKINFGDNTLTLREDGFLLLRTEKGGVMVFSRNREARWTQKLPEE